MKPRYRSTKLLVSIFMVAAALMFQSTLLNAQLPRGVISGTVTDPSEAVVPGVAVTITNVATNIQQQALTNDVGVFRFVVVEPGTYSLEFKMPGFQTRKIDKIVLGSAQEVVINQKLIVSAEATVLEVREKPQGVELAKTTPTIQRTLSERMVSEMPFTGNTRDVTRAVLLAPTVSRAPGSNEIRAA